MELSELLVRIAQDIMKKGGRAYYVGGYVRDLLMHRHINDYDIEVHNLKSDDLIEILSKYGEVFYSGASFGVYRIKGLDVDFSLPRLEVLTGNGHKDFDIIINPFLSLKEATRRRDFTINAMMKDILTGKIIDLWGGQEDIKNKVIRHIDPEKFKEDPLRVLRAARFAAQLNFTISEETKKICKTINITYLPKERIFMELEKALTHSDKPSVFFEELYSMNHLDEFFPELELLIGREQSPKYHHDDAWTHTMVVLDKAVQVLHVCTLEFLLMALYHDIGKSMYSDYRHATESTPIVQIALGRITNQRHLLKYISTGAKAHMEILKSFNDPTNIKQTLKILYKNKTFKDLLLSLTKVDLLASIHEGTDKEFLRELNKIEKLLLYKYRIFERRVMYRFDFINELYLTGEELNKVHSYRLDLCARPIPMEEISKRLLHYIKSNHMGIYKN